MNSYITVLAVSDFSQKSSEIKQLNVRPLIVREKMSCFGKILVNLGENISCFELALRPIGD